MALLFMSEWDSADEWTRMLREHIPDLNVRVWPDVGDPAVIDVVLAWKPPAGAINSLPNLKLIQSLGMGVDHLFVHPDLPEGVPVARLVDPHMAMQMSEYALLWALHHHRRIEEYAWQQIEKKWKQLRVPDTRKTTVGVMGLGVLGGDAARKFATVGFRTIGWSRSAKNIDGVTSFAGADGLLPFLGESQILVNLLPLTDETEGILDARAFAALPEDAFVINIARGAHVVEDDLLAAVDSGHLAGAALDVFRDEPPPPEHRFWSHPKIRMTPHIAGLTHAETGAAQVADNIQRVRAGKPPENEVEPARGY